MKKIMMWTMIVATATMLMMPVAIGCRSEVMSTEKQRKDATGAQAGAQFHWKGNLGQDSTIEIKGLNGDVRAIPSSGTEVEVSAVKRGRRSNPEEVQIKVLKHAGGVTICSVYPSDNQNKPNSCESGEAAPMNVNNNDVQVDFNVRVPRSVRFVGRTVNGEIDARSLASDAEGYSIRGNVHISTNGLARARTSNGSIDASFRSMNWTTPLVFETASGNITLRLPTNVNAKVQARTQTGNIKSAFPLPVVQTHPPARSVEGTIGSGANLLIIKTNNGNIELESIK